MASRPIVYRTSQGRIRGVAGGPPVGPTASVPGGFSPALVCSAMTALPLGRQHDGRTGACHTPDPVQRADGGLQCRDVAHTDLQEVPLAAGHAPAVLDLRHRPNGLLEAGVVDRVAL